MISIVACRWLIRSGLPKAGVVKGARRRRLGIADVVFTCRLYAPTAYLIGVFAGCLHRCPEAHLVVHTPITVYATHVLFCAHCSARRSGFPKDEGPVWLEGAPSPTNCQGGAGGGRLRRRRRGARRGAGGGKAAAEHEPERRVRADHCARGAGCPAAGVGSWKSARVAHSAYSMVKSTAREIMLYTYIVGYVNHSSAAG